MEYLFLLIELGCTVSLCRNVAVDTQSDPPTLLLDNAKVFIPPEHEFLFSHILTLQDAPISLDALCDAVADQHSIAGMTHFYRFLHWLSAGGVLLFHIPGTIELRPMNSRLAEGKPRLLAGTRYRLSRFSFMRNYGKGLYLESALNPVQVKILDNRLLEMVTRSEGVTLEDLKSCAHTQKANLHNALLLFLNYMLLIPEGEERKNLRYWEFHDLLLHGRSRAGSHFAGFGPTYRFKDAPPPSLEDDPDGRPVVLLEKPDIDRYLNNSPSFFSVTENRFSHRVYSEAPMTLADLEALLYLSARVKARYNSVSYEATLRPYPGGGALYELELYLSISRCTDLEPGVYHYSPEKHALYLVSKANVLTEKLMREAGMAAQCNNFHALLSIGARFDRVMWKYEALAYSLILKDCGVFMQNFCLACSALGLGSCILGAGSSSLLSEITGRDMYLEAAVGELIFGTPGQSSLPSGPGRALL